MLLKVGLVLLVAWFIGVLGIYQAGSLVHVLLLVGLMLLLLAFVKARDADRSAGPEPPPPPGKP